MKSWQGCLLRNGCQKGPIHPGECGAAHDPHHVTGPNCLTEDDSGEDQAEEDRKFIAAVNPQTILALLAIVRAADELVRFLPRTQTSPLAAKKREYDAARAALEELVK